jgi:activator of 2-hydroxyglutaryl-CoA dehydratase
MPCRNWKIPRVDGQYSRSWDSGACTYALEGENIARGIVNSITGRAYALLHKHGAKGPLFFTGGLCEVEPFVYLLSEKLGTTVKTNSMARYAGSTGAVLIAMKIR